jgi:hypothetical protein
MSAATFIYTIYNLHVRVNFVRGQFVGHICLTSTPSTYFVTADLQTILRTKFLGIFAVYPHAKFHIPTRNKGTLNTMITHYYFP